MTSNHNWLCKGWVGRLYHSNYQCKSRGAAILVNRKTPFVMQTVNADHWGRYVVVTGTLYNIPIILANVYVQNGDVAQFLKTFLSSLPNLNINRLILGGDFNCVLHPVLDRSSSTPYNVTRSWQYPDFRHYSFFSTVHHSYSRIDYFLIDSQLLTSVRDCRYESIVISVRACSFANILP